MKRYTHFLFLEILLLSFSAFSQTSENWKLTSEQKEFDLKIYLREIKDSPIKEVKSIALLPGAPRSVFQVVTDYTHLTEYMPYLKENRVLKNQNHHYVIYQYLDFPLVDDRDYVIDVEHIINEKDNVYGTRWQSNYNQGIKELDGVIRLKVNRGSWELHPFENGRKTHAVYYVYTDPGGSIPAWVANKANTIAIPDLFETISEQIKKRKLP